MPQTRFSHYFTIAVAECFCFYCTFTYSIAYTLHTYVSLSALFLFYCTAIIIAIITISYGYFAIVENSGLMYTVKLGYCNVFDLTLNLNS